MGFLRRRKVEDFVINLGRDMLNKESRVAGANPSKAFTSAFHISFLYRFLAYSSALAFGISANNSDILNAVSNALGKLKGEFFLGDENQALLTVQNSFSGNASEEAERIVIPLIRAMNGDAVARRELEGMLPKMSSGFKRGARAAGIDLNDIPSITIAYYFTRPLLDDVVPWGGL